MIDSFMNAARARGCSVADRSFKLIAWTLIAATIYELAHAVDHAGMLFAAFGLIFLIYGLSQEDV